jgi:hypothetical protein
MMNKILFGCESFRLFFKSIQRFVGWRVLTDF